MRVGVISDTHGLLRPEAVAALEGADLIIHAGGVGRPEVLSSLAAIAPTHAVRGNVDTQAWAAALPGCVVVAAAGRRIFVLHDVSDLDVDPATERCDVVVFGHSHRALIEDRGGVLFLNPGSAGPRRFRLPVTLAILEIDGDLLRPEIITLAV